VSSRRRVVVAVIRAVLAAGVLIALYYLLPLDLDDSATSTFVKLLGGLCVFATLMTWQLKSITRSDSPALQAFKALGLVVPLFLLIFAASYYMMAQSESSSFTSPLTRTDALYFTVTIFSTVGFGDISAKSQTARLVVSAQMVLDLIILGLGVRVLAGAVERGRDRISSETGVESSTAA
jgi:voltage-gated potassium channel